MRVQVAVLSWMPTASKQQEEVKRCSKRQQHCIGLLYGTTLHLEWPTMMAVRKLLTKLWQCASIVQHVLFMLTVTRLTCQLICEDIIPVRQFAAQGGKGESRQDEFYPPQLLNSLTVTSQTGQAFAMVVGAGFCCMIKTLEPWYKIPSRKYFSNTVISALYRETLQGTAKWLSSEI